MTKNKEEKINHQSRVIIGWAMNFINSYGSGFAPSPTRTIRIQNLEHEAFEKARFYISQKGHGLRITSPDEIRID